MQKERHQVKKIYNQQAGQVKITFYTDPLCCWSWAFEQHWQSLLSNYQDIIKYEYVMCGLIADWNTYNDPLNSVSKPLQMGPVWMHASEVTGVKMKYSIWHENPPLSSYPACIAVKTAALQSKAAEEMLLLSLRKSLMEDGLNISKPDVIFSIAEKANEETDTDFDISTFKDDWRQGRGKELFKQDLQKARFHNIGRYPTLTFQRSGEAEGIIMVGYRAYDVLQQIMEKVIEDVK